MTTKRLAIGLVLTLSTAVASAAPLPSAASAVLQALGDPVDAAAIAAVPTTCTPGDDAACDDGNVCTDDRCDPVRGCVSEPIAGTCWLLRGRTTFIATALGHTCTCTQSAGFGALALKDDGTYGSDGGTCPGSGQALTDETGTTQPKGRRLLLAPDNFPAVLASTTACAGGTDVRVDRHRTSVKTSADGSQLRGTNTLRERADGSPVSVTAVTHFTGQPGDGNVPRETPRLRCAGVLESCLRNAIQH